MGHTMKTDNISNNNEPASTGAVLEPSSVQPAFVEGTKRRKKHDFSNGPVLDEDLGRWLVEVRYPNDERVKRRFRRADQAWKFWNDQQDKIRDGTWNRSRLPKTITFSEATAEYLEWKRNTRSFQSVRAHLKPWGRVFDSDRLSEVTEDRIVKVINRRLDDGVTKGGVDSDLAWLKAFFNWLERKKKYVLNPTKDIQFFRENDHGLIYLTPPWMHEDPLADQFSRVIEACKDGPWFLLPMVILGTFTGLRKCNNYGLKWTWVYLESRTLVIPTTQAKGKRTITIPMDSMTAAEPIVYQTLKQLYETRHERGVSEYVFPQPEPKAAESVSPAQLDKAWHKARAQAGIDHDFQESHNDSFHFHDLRHTFASWHAMRGTDLYTLMRLMAHASIDQTQRYAHLSPRFLRDNGARHDGMFPKFFPKPRTNGGKSRSGKATSSSDDLVIKL
jgi:integrase